MAPDPGETRLRSLPDRLRHAGDGTVRRAATAAVAGAAAALGQAPFDLVPIALPGFAAIFALVASARGARQAGWIGWAAGTGYFACALHWIVEPFLVDAPRHGWMAPFALILLASGLALFWALASWAARRLTAAPLGLVALWPAAMTLAALARGHVLTGFPWALPGYVWTDTPALPAVAVTGPYGLSFVTLLIAALLGHAVLARRPAAAALAAMSVAAVLALGAARPAPPPADPGAPVVRLVQPNAAQHEKWDPDKVNLFFNRQLAATAALPRPDLVIWPETAIPWMLERAEPALAHVAEAASGATVILGALRTEAGAVRNSLAAIGPDGTVRAVYDKHHLVPFGEYIPLPGLFRRIGIRGIAERVDMGFAPGPGPRVIDLGPLGTALPLICYEAVFPQDLRATARPDWLVQITNDAWFGGFAGPRQHLAQARIRAAERGLPLLRVANTGITAAIDARGRLLDSLALGTDGHLDIVLPPALPPTPYARSGDLPALALGIAICLAGALAARRDTS